MLLAVTLLGRVSSEGRQGRSEPPGITRRQAVRDDSQYRPDLVDIRAAMPVTAGIGSVPSPCVRIAQVGPPEPQGLPRGSQPQALTLKGGQHRPATR